MPSDGSNWAQALGTPQAARSYSSQQKKTSNTATGRPGVGGCTFHVAATATCTPLWKNYRGPHNVHDSGVVSTVFFLCFFDDHLLAF